MDFSFLNKYICNKTYKFKRQVGGDRLVRWCWVNFQCRSVLVTLIIVGQVLSALTVGADGDCLDIFSLIYHSLFFLPPSGRWPDID